MANRGFIGFIESVRTTSCSVITLALFQILPQAPTSKGSEWPRNTPEQPGTRWYRLEWLELVSKTRRPEVSSGRKWTSYRDQKSAGITAKLAAGVVCALTWSLIPVSTSFVCWSQRASAKPGCSASLWAWLHLHSPSVARRTAVQPRLNVRPFKNAVAFYVRVILNFAK